jgi:hypothetical protein
MPERSEFYALITDGQFHQAAQLLKNEIIAARYVDPEDDYTWGVEADILAYQILERAGAQAFIDFHFDLLCLFQEMEKNWSHLHKGHLYFRIGLGYLAFDRQLAKTYLEKAYQEDYAFAKTVAGKQFGDTAEEVVQNFPSYITLVILELLQNVILPVDEQEAFDRGLAGLRFDVVWDRKEVDPYQVKQALCRLASPDRWEDLDAAYGELALISRMNCNFALHACVAAFVERLVALFQPAISAENLVDRVLGAHRSGAIPSGEIFSVLLMIALVERQMPAGEPRAREFPVSSNVSQLIGLCEKILLDKALIRWGKE